MAGLHANRGAKRAREARERFGPPASEPVACLLALVEREAQIPVVVRRFPGTTIAGAFVQRGGRGLVFLNGEQALVRQRFTLAHELGHLCCGHDGRGTVDTVQTLAGPRTGDELEANAFAATFLMPVPAVGERVDGDTGLEELVRLAHVFGVSAIAMLHRLTSLELVGVRRAARLRREVDEGLHELLAAHLRLAPRDDGLQRIDALPYLSPALADSALAAALRGDASIGAAAHAADVAADRLGPAVEDLAR